MSFVFQVPNSGKALDVMAEVDSCHLLPFYQDREDQ
jgi:hypothetical protein